jgi:hypothetical protein
MPLAALPVLVSIFEVEVKDDEPKDERREAEGHAIVMNLSFIR